MPKPYRFNDLIDQCPLHCQDPVNTIEPLLPSQIEQVADAFREKLLTPLFVFITSGRKVSISSKARDSMGVRVWVALHIISPEHLQGETISAYARRVGVAEEWIHQLSAEFRAIMAERSNVKKQLVKIDHTPR